MRNIIIAIFTSLLLFAASAGTSLYLNQPAETPSDPDAGVEKIDLPPDDPFPKSPIEELASQMPVGIRPDQALTIDAVRQMSESAEKRQKQLDQYADDLKKEEQRIQIMMKDMKKEKMELTAFSEGVEDKIRALDDKTVQLNDLISRIEAEKKELKSLERKTGIAAKEANSISARVNEIKGWLAGMDADQAANVLTEQANSGELELAAQLLHSLEERQRAKILSAMEDTTLIKQLLNSVDIPLKKGKE